MNAPKVSVIIPVYNTDEYIEEAIRSIMNQTLSELEIIIVNDGSTDNSLQIITHLQSIDKRIFVYSQKNAGQAAARNNGLRYATGEYIYFMDSDDILLEDTLKVCYEKCTSDHLDFAFFDADNFSDSNITLPLSYDRKGKISTDIKTGLESLNEQVDKSQYRVPVWLYFINKDFLTSINLNFFVGLKYEDQIFTAKLFVFAKKVAYISETFFHRRLRPGSIMTTQYSLRSVHDYFDITDNLLLFGSEQDEYTNKTIHKTVRYIFDPAIYMANILSWNERWAIAKVCFAKYRKYVSAKSWLVLLFPWLIKLKSYTK